MDKQGGEHSKRTRKIEHKKANIRKQTNQRRKRRFNQKSQKRRKRTMDSVNLTYCLLLDNGGAFLSFEDTSKSVD
jgi:hypothetical protein